MTIVNPLSASNMVVHVPEQASRPDRSLTDLRVDQVIRATVTEGGMDKATLEMHQKQFPIQTDQPLKMGQQLDLQVLTTQPRLSFKILSSPLESKLTALLPLLAKTYNWDSLLQLQGERPQSAAVSQALDQLSGLMKPVADLSTQDLFSLIRRLEPFQLAASKSTTDSAARLNQTLSQVLATLNTMGEELELPQQLQLLAQFIRQQPELRGALTDKMQGQLTETLRLLEPSPATQTPARALEQLLANVPSALAARAAPPAVQEFVAQLNQLAQQKHMAPRDLHSGIKALVAQLSAPTANRGAWPLEVQSFVEKFNHLNPVGPQPDIPTAGQLMAELQGALATKTATPGASNLPLAVREFVAQLNNLHATAMTTPGEALAAAKDLIARLQTGAPYRGTWPLEIQQFAAQLNQLERGNSSASPRAVFDVLTGLQAQLAPHGKMAAEASLPKDLLALINQLAEQKPTLAPGLPGQMHELARQLASVRSADGGALPLPPQLIDQLLAGMRPLLAEPDPAQLAGKLGLLSQLLGLNLEAEVLRGRTREALSSLKLALLDHAQDLNPKEQEALHRLELFQVCRARLADQGQLFLPLPLAFLEEGFLLVQQDDDAEQKTAADKESVHMALYLRLSALGNVKIDILAEPGGLRLRVIGEDQEKVDFLESLSERLRSQLQQVPLRSLSFATGVETPTRELLKKLVPDSQRFFEARI